MTRSPESILLGVAALLVSAGLVVSTLPITRTAATGAPPADASPCPFAELVIVSPPTSTKEPL